MKPYFGLRGTNLNIMIGVIAGLDFLYVGLSIFTLEVRSTNVELHRLFGYDQYVIESYT